MKFTNCDLWPGRPLLQRHVASRRPIGRVLPVGGAQGVDLQHHFQREDRREAALSHLMVGGAGRRACVLFHAVSE